MEVAAKEVYKLRRAGLKASDIAAALGTTVDDVRTALTFSTGSEDPKPENDVGARYGRLVIVERVSAHVWICRCDCGVVRKFGSVNLKQGTVSCGCYMRDKMERHAAAKAKLEAERAEVRRRKEAAAEAKKIEAEAARAASKFARHVDRTGQRHGQLTILSLARKGVRQIPALWRCRCDCGREFQASWRGIQSGKTRTCGCGGKRYEVLGEQLTLSQLAELAGVGVMTMKSRLCRLSPIEAVRSLGKYARRRR